jgi:quercetin dioxygenase-like cupin family protein
MLDSPARTFHLAGNIITIMTSPSGGNLMVATCRSRPGAGSPHNRHPGDDESFFVLSGEYEFLVDGARERLGPGGFVAIPNGSPHQFTNTASTDSTMLIICTPGLVHERFFSEAGAPLPHAQSDFPATEGAAELAALRSIAERCGIEFLPPAEQ